MIGNAEPLIKFIELFKNCKYGTRHGLEKRDDNSFYAGYIEYSNTVIEFIEACHKFVEENEELNLYEYQEILEKNGLKWEKESLFNADISKINAQCICAIIIGIVRAERFSEGTLLTALENNIIQKYLLKL